MIVNSVEKENTQIIMVPGIIPFNMQGLILKDGYLVIRFPKLYLLLLKCKLKGVKRNLEGIVKCWEKIYGNVRVLS